MRWICYGLLVLVMGACEGRESIEFDELMKQYGYRDLVLDLEEDMVRKTQRMEYIQTLEVLPKKRFFAKAQRMISSLQSKIQHEYLYEKEFCPQLVLLELNILKQNLIQYCKSIEQGKYDPEWEIIKSDILDYVSNINIEDRAVLMETKYGFGLASSDVLLTKCKYDLYSFAQREVYQPQPQLMLFSSKNEVFMRLVYENNSIGQYSLEYRVHSNYYKQSHRSFTPSITFPFSPYHLYYVLTVFEEKTDYWYSNWLNY